MIGIQQELAQLQGELVELINRWNRLGLIGQAKVLVSYTQNLDEGTSGHHPFGRLLINPWCDGWSEVAGVNLDFEGNLGPPRPTAT